MPEHYKKHLMPLLLLLLALVASRMLFIYLMPVVWSRDLYAWLDVINLLKEGGNPYRDTGVLNWPPFWMQILFVIGRVAEATALPATRLIQATLIAGEAMVLVVCYALALKIGVRGNLWKVITVVLVVNPICMLLSCVHCNFDVFVGLWVLLFIYSLLGFYQSQSLVHWLAACFFLGIGILTKTVPFILAPILIVGVQKQRLQVLFFGFLLVVMPVLVGMSVIYTLAPAGVGANVLGYRSMAGWYGITGILNLLDMHGLISAFKVISPYLLLLLIGLTGFRLRRLQALSAQELLVTVLTLLVFLPTFGPGYSPPYILWFLPVMVLFYMGTDKRMRYVMTGGLVILILNYVVEYAFFNSHGSFIRMYDSSEKMAALSDYLGQSTSQSFIRLPMFASYVMFYVLLLRHKSNVVTHPQVVW